MEMELSYATIIVHSCPRNEKFIIVYRNEKGTNGE